MNIPFTIFLVVHIATGSEALISGFIAMLAVKGSSIHRFSGKCFFWAMTASCISAMYLSIAHPNSFLLMIAVFSYQLVAIGYRSLYLKKLFTGTLKPKPVDWLIGIVPAVFNISIFCWGVFYVLHQEYFGFTGIIFGIIGFIYSFNWLKRFFAPPKEKQHWIFTHLQGFGAAYIAAATAFMVVNINFLPTIFVWLSPAVVGATLITITSIKYKRKFSKHQKIKHITE